MSYSFSGQLPFSPNEVLEFLFNLEDMLQELIVQTRTLSETVRAQQDVALTSVHKPW
ncbi:MAG: hypothetical protein Q7R83_02960 [bacterium]|nr:hypothetical protein [bacterium]